ncbi:hypothetical protein LEMLEM_LOCUS18639, partial [Lemmus lemmus]
GIGARSSGRRAKCIENFRGKRRKRIWEEDSVDLTIEQTPQRFGSCRYLYDICHVFYLSRESYEGKLNLHLWRTIWIPDPDRANFYVYSYLERHQRW